MTELRCERALLRRCAWAAMSRPLRSTADAPRRTTAPNTAAAFLWMLLGLVVAVNVVVVCVVFFPVAPIVVAVLVLALGYVHVLGSLWWSTGAGAPVLAVRDAELRGRLRPVRKGSRPDPDDAGWWDFALPLDRVRDVRVHDTSVRPVRRYLVVDLPDDVTAELAGNPATAVYARRWVRYCGSPAAWPAGRMLARAGRAARLDALVAHLRAAAGVQSR